jgi:hypothetical protein
MASALGQNETDALQGPHRRVRRFGIADNRERAHSSDPNSVACLGQPKSEDGFQDLPSEQSSGGGTTKRSRQGVCRTGRTHAGRLPDKRRAAASLRPRLKRLLYLMHRQILHIGIFQVYLKNVHAGNFRLCGWAREEKDFDAKPNDQHCDDCDNMVGSHCSHLLLRVSVRQTWHFRLSERRFGSACRQHHCRKLLQRTLRRVAVVEPPHTSSGLYCALSGHNATGPMSPERTPMSHSLLSSDAAAAPRAGSRFAWIVTPEPHRRQSDKRWVCGHGPSLRRLPALKAEPQKMHLVRFAHSASPR